MIVKIGEVRDGVIQPAQWFSSHTHVIVPMFTAQELRATVDGFQKGGPKNLSAQAPASLKRDFNTLAGFIVGGWNEYLASLPPRANPLFTVNGKSGLVLPHELNKAN